jgi:fatty acid desaturase
MPFLIRLNASGTFMTAIAGAQRETRARPVEWATLGLMGATYGLWGAALWLWLLSPWIAIPVTGVLIAFHASLTHEAVHGHPFTSRRSNELLMGLPLSLAVPYRRFRDLHLAHHRDSRLTDPYEDPETNYLDPAVWARLSALLRVIYRMNNTLLGRMVLGPLIGQVHFLRDDWRAMRNGDRSIATAWALHGVGAAPVLAFVAWSPMPVWGYLMAAYAGLSLLRIRTFAEHRAHEMSQARTVIIEDRGPLAFLFLNNNLHVVHHMHPRAPWYALPRLYAQGKDRYRARNDGYIYPSYGALFRSYLWRAKDPVPHPLWRDR